MKAPGAEQTGTGPFQIIKDASVILNKSGHFASAPLMRRGEFVFCWDTASTKGKLFALKSDGKTTIEGVKWDEIIGVEVEFSALGRMVVKS